MTAALSTCACAVGHVSSSMRRCWAQYPAAPSTRRPGMQARKTLKREPLRVGVGVDESSCSGMEPPGVSGNGMRRVVDCLARLLPGDAGRALDVDDWGVKQPPGLPKNTATRGPPVHGETHVRRPDVALRHVDIGIWTDVSVVESNTENHPAVLELLSTVPNVVSAATAEHAA